VKIAKGNPGKRPLNQNEPVPPASAIAPPDWVAGVSREKWDEIVPKLIAMGVMTSADIDTIARYCVMHEHFQKYLAACRRGLDIFVMRDEAGRVKYMQSAPAATMMVKLAASMLRIEQEFGLTPSARSGISAATQKPIDEVTQFFRVHGA
jgi:P27 family predicted phage terminase small subunit